MLQNSVKSLRNLHRFLRRTGRFLGVSLQRRDQRDLGVGVSFLFFAIRAGGSFLWELCENSGKSEKRRRDTAVGACGEDVHCMRKNRRRCMR
jgi:hypothetical protein